MHIQTVARQLKHIVVNNFRFALSSPSQILIFPWINWSRLRKINLLYNDDIIQSCRVIFQTFLPAYNHWGSSDIFRAYFLGQWCGHSNFQLDHFTLRANWLNLRKLSAIVHRDRVSLWIFPPSEHLCQLKLCYYAVSTYFFFYLLTILL